MNAIKSMLSLAPSLRVAMFAGIAAIAPLAQAGTLWIGSGTNFTQKSGNSDVLVAGKVSMGRLGTGPLFNAATETSSDYSTSPHDTMWAFGSLPGTNFTYHTFASLRNGNLAGVILNQPMVMHMVAEDIYVGVKFTAWGQHGAGSFTYTRSMPAVVRLTNPVANVVLAAPASVNIGATNNITGFTVTNVTFRNGSTVLGTATASPFTFTASNLAAGSYALTAVATASGISTTSSVVSISVVNPVSVTLSSPQVASGKFSFTYSADPGLTYVVQNSSALPNWTSISTNVATTNAVHVTNTVAGSGAGFYQVIRQPNP